MPPFRFCAPLPGFKTFPTCVFPHANEQPEKLAQGDFRAKPGAGSFQTVGMTLASGRLAKLPFSPTPHPQKSGLLCLLPFSLGIPRKAECGESPVENVTHDAGFLPKGRAEARRHLQRKFL